METRYFNTLIRVCETGSFSKAAESLHITQSAVSQRIKFLEEAYSQQLLDRSGSLLKPTEPGRLVLKKAREIVAKEQELLDGLRLFNGEKRLSICSTPTFGMAYLPQVLNTFVLRNADVSDLKFIFKQPAEAVWGIQNKEFDVAVIEYCDPELLDPFVSYPLPDDELIFISSPALQLPPSPMDIRELLPFPLFARRDGCSSKDLLNENLAGLGHSAGDFKTLVISDDLRLSIETVLAGGSVSFVSRSLVEGYLRDNRLCAHHVRNFRHMRHRAVFHLGARTGDPLIQDFVNCLLESLVERERQGRRHTDAFIAAGSLSAGG